MKTFIAILTTLVILLSGCDTKEIDNVNPNTSEELTNKQSNVNEERKQEFSIIEKDDSKEQNSVIEKEKPNDLIDEKNWIQHPEIVKIRNIYNTIENSISDYKKEEFSSSSLFTDSVFYIDSTNKIRKYIKSGGTEDSALTYSFYYDENGTLRFVFITGGAVNGTQLEHRIYFNSNEIKIWEIQKYVQGPGYPWPSKWPNDTLDFDPNEKLSEFIIENKDLEEKSIVLQWDFERTFIKNINGEYPATKVFLRFNNNPNNRLYIGTFLGDPYDRDNIDDYPENTLMACSFWYAGAGDDLALIRKDKESIGIYQRQEDEGSNEVDGYIFDFLELKQLKTSKNAEIKVEKSINH